MFEVKRVKYDSVLTEEFDQKIKQCADEAKNFLKNYVNSGIIPKNIISDSEALNFADIHKDVPVALDKNLINFSHSINTKLIRFVMQLYPNSFITPSGNFIYPNNGYMGWHTNSDYPSKRVYISYVEEQNNSGFKYITGRGVIDDKDNEKIIIREFDIKKDELCWHAVYSYTNRYSFGFRVE